MPRKAKQIVGSTKMRRQYGFTMQSFYLTVMRYPTARLVVYYSDESGFGYRGVVRDRAALRKLRDALTAELRRAKRKEQTK